LKEEYEKLKKIEDVFSRSLHTVALLTELMIKDKNVAPVLVGGAAVAVYSRNLYTTRDMDLILFSYVDVNPYMEKLNFQKIGKDYYNKELDVLIEFPSGKPTDSEDKVLKLRLSEDSFIYVISVEDLILDRVHSYNTTNDNGSKEWALRLIGAFYETIDWNYIHKTAHSRGIGTVLVKLQRQHNGLI
jgi:hypothetical protein